MSSLCTREKKNNKNGLTLNVQLGWWRNCLVQLVDSAAAVVAGVARLHAGEEQRWPRLPDLLLVFVPGVFAYRRVGSASAEQSHGAALHHGAVTVDNNCSFLWRNWTKGTASFSVTGRVCVLLFVLFSCILLDLQRTSIWTTEEFWAPYWLLARQKNWLSSSETTVESLFSEPTSVTS